MAKSRLNKREVESKMREVGGNVSLAARHFGVARMTIYRFLERHDLTYLPQEAREEMCDFAETGLRRAILNGEAYAICFTLKTLGKARGYVERVQQEVTGKNGGAVEVRTVFSHAAAVASATAGSGEDSA